jgi:hypothetical protein
MFVRTLVALLLFAAPALAEQGAEAFLHTIYDQYKGAEGPPLDDAAIQKYFTPEMAGLIKKDSDAAKARGGVPLLNGDPFIDAQDWQIDGLKIVVDEPKPGIGVGVVTFNNFGQPFEIRLDLAKTPEGWRIAEIYAPSGTLRELFAK